MPLTISYDEIRIVSSYGTLILKLNTTVTSLDYPQATVSSSFLSIKPIVELYLRGAMVARY